MSSRVSHPAAKPSNHPDAAKRAKPAKSTKAAKSSRSSKTTKSAKPSDDLGVHSSSADDTEGDDDDLQEKSDEGEVIEVAAELLDAAVEPRARIPIPQPKQEDSSSSYALTRFDPLRAYMREVQRHPLLTPEQEYNLAVKYAETGDVEAAATLVSSNLRLVVKIAYEYRRAYRNIMDIIQEGNIGLMQAVKRFDPYRGVKLSSYAAWWIRAYILRFVLNNWRLVKLGTTQNQRKLFFNLNKEKARLSAMGIEPTSEEIAKRLHVEEREVIEMDQRLASREASLDAPIGDTEGRPVSRLEMQPSKIVAQDVQLAEGQYHAMVREHLQEYRKTLTNPKDIAIFDERWMTDEPLTLQEIGVRFGISRERVRQLEARMLLRVREYLEQQLGDTVAPQ